MSTPAAPDEEGFEVVVGTDGARVPRRRVRGTLAGVIDAEVLDAFEDALDHSKAERIAAAERRWV